MSDSETDVSCTPPELREVAKTVTDCLLPAKSKDRYEKVYHSYKAWCDKKGVQNLISENIVLAYFAALANEKKASTLWATYSMLRATINIKHDVDISKYVKLRAYLKKQNVNYKAKKSSVFTREQIHKFLSEAPQEYLPQKTKEASNYAEDAVENPQPTGCLPTDNELVDPAKVEMPTISSGALYPTMTMDTTSSQSEDPLAFEIKPDETDLIMNIRNRFKQVKGKLGVKLSAILGGKENQYLNCNAVIASNDFKENENFKPKLEIKIDEDYKLPEINDIPKDIENKQQTTKHSENYVKNLHLQEKQVLSDVTKKGETIENNECLRVKFSTESFTCLSYKPVLRENDKKKINQNNENVTKNKSNIPQKAMYFCHVCDDNVKLTSTQLREHLKRHAGIEKLTKQYFLRARARRTRPRRLVQMCEICFESFPNRIVLEEHLEKHENQYFCDVCNAGFKKLIDHICHVKEHSEDKLYQCSLCQFKTAKHFKVRAHLYSQHEQFRKYKCKTCGKGFHLYTDFEDHQNLHTGEKPFQCDVCGISFMYSRLLKVHKSSKHSNKPLEHFECSICQEVFTSQRKYSLHEIRHRDRSCICDICGKKISNIQTLQQHMKTHSEDRPFKCKHCDKSFKSCSTKRDHEKIHTGVKNKQCPICGKGFIQRTSMVRHWRNHTEKDSFTCHGCARDFVTKKRLIIHIQSNCPSKGKAFE